MCIIKCNHDTPLVFVYSSTVRQPSTSEQTRHQDPQEFSLEKSSIKKQLRNRVTCLGTDSEATARRSLCSSLGLAGSSKISGGGREVGRILALQIDRGLMLWEGPS